MISRLFAKKDEVILTAFTVLVVGGLIYQGISAWYTGKEHAVFHTEKAVSLKK